MCVLGTHNDGDGPWQAFMLAPHALPRYPTRKHGIANLIAPPTAALPIQLRQEPLLSFGIAVQVGDQADAAGGAELDTADL